MENNPLENLLLLGNPQLHEISLPVKKDELSDLGPVISSLHATLIAFRKTYGAGRAIAAPQIGIKKRIIYYHVNEPVVMINPLITNQSEEMIELWDDCLCFPELLVRVKRHKRCQLEFTDLQWKPQKWKLEDDLSELFQHEYDHLDGVLATQRAIDHHSFKYRPQPFKRLK